MSATQIETVSTLLITEPVLTTEPAYRGHALKSLHVKSHGVSDGQMPTVVAEFDVSSTTSKPAVPYRLPRISPQGTPRLSVSEEITDSSSDQTEKMWGRFGYEEVIRIPALMPSINKVSIVNNNNNNNVNNSSSDNRGNNNVSNSLVHPAFNPAVPRFKNAALTPRKLKQDEFTVYKSMVEKAKLIDGMEQVPHSDPTPTPVSRIPSPTKSVKSIHWALGNNFKRQLTFDRKGRGRVQGPFSREFTVTCYAPHNWLKLKLGRSKTTLH